MQCQLVKLCFLLLFCSASSRGSLTSAKPTSVGQLDSSPDRANSTDQSERAALGPSKSLAQTGPGLSMKDYHEFHTARKALMRAPCTLQLVQVFNKSQMAYDSALDDLKDLSIDSEFPLMPVEEQTETCLAQFDNLASELYSLNFKARDSLVSKWNDNHGYQHGTTLDKTGIEKKVETQEFMRHIAYPALVTPLSYELVKANIEALYDEHATFLATLKSVSASELCQSVNASKKLQSMKTIMQAMIGSNSNLRTKSIQHKLKMQTPFDEPSAAQVLCLTLFCEQYSKAKTS